MIDKYVIGKYERQSPEADIPLLAYTKEEYRLGGAANVALNLKHLGQKSILIGVLGKDDSGKELASLCNKEKINHDFLSLKSRPTTVKTRYVDSSYKQYLRLDHESKKYLKGKEEKSLLSKIKKCFKQNSLQAVIIQDYNKGAVTRNVITLLQKTCKEKNILLCVDPKYKYFKLLSDCDVFKPNLNEIIKASGTKLKPTVKSLSTSMYLKSLRTEHLIITLASRGIYHHYQNKAHIDPGHKVKNADVSGAGDTVISVLCILYCMRINPYIIPKIANMAGALICKKKGVSTLSRSELSEIINKMS